MQLPCETPDPFDLALLPHAISLAHASLPVRGGEPMTRLVSIGAFSHRQCASSFRSISLPSMSGFRLVLLAHLPETATPPVPDPDRSHTTLAGMTSCLATSRGLLTNGAVLLWQLGGPHSQIHCPSHLRDKNEAPGNFSGLWDEAGRGDKLRDLGLSWTTSALI